MSLSDYFDSGIVKLHRPNEEMATQVRDYDNVLVVYHAQCVDGYTAAMVCWSATSGRATLIPAEYQKPIIWPTVTGRTWILFVDFCPNIQLLNQLVDMYERVTVIDHHVGQTEAVEQFVKRERAEILFTIERSGAYLAWLFAHGTEPPAVIRAVDDYDRWQFKLAGTREIHAALGARPHVVNEWAVLTDPNRIEANRSYSDLELISQGKALLMQHLKHCQDIRDSQDVRFMRILKDDDDNGGVWPMLVPLYNAPKWLASDIGHELAKQHDVGGTYYITRNFAVVSLRGTGVHDLAAICKRYGGGGHKNAAGFTVPVQVADMMFREAHDIMYGESRGNGS